MALQKVKKINKVYVALSGGVDSATAALLLKQKGYDVTGVYMKTWAPPGYPCPWKNEKRDAMRVCAKLKIPFCMWDFTKEYKAKVVDYMVKEYVDGKTPNPDVMCNKEIKFGLFFDRAISEGAHFIATGHYARIVLSGAKVKVMKAEDKNKDQTYFLWAISPAQAERTLMPIGEIASKQEVRNLAKKHSLPVSDKKDSQGICFIGPIDLHEFIGDHHKEREGHIVTTSNKNIGVHAGLSRYTVGQRGGIGIGGLGPYYVAKKDYKTNSLIVAPPAEEVMLYSTVFVLKDENYISHKPKKGEQVEVSVRYGQTPVRAMYDGNGRVITDEPLRAVTEGQSAVLYKNDELLGGGVIKTVL